MDTPHRRRNRPPHQPRRDGGTADSHQGHPQSSPPAHHPAGDGFSSHTLILGGEALHTDHLTAWRAQHPDVQVINAYGPTESTVNITDHHVNEDTPDGPVPIGRPFANTQVYVLDAALRPVPPGITGELYLAGEQLARGYHARPALTSERFVANPFGDPGTRLYRTGDLAHWNHHGHLTYDGRTDHQIKLRGHRIELGEIDTTLNNQPGISQATVQLREDQPGDQRLVAYLVTTDEYDENTLRGAVAHALPDYMRPTAYVVLDALPSPPTANSTAKPSPHPPTPPQPPDEPPAPPAKKSSAPSSPKYSASTASPSTTTSSTSADTPSSPPASSAASAAPSVSSCRSGSCSRRRPSRDSPTPSTRPAPSAPRSPRSRVPSTSRCRTPSSASGSSTSSKALRRPTTSPPPSASPAPSTTTPCALRPGI